MRTERDAFESGIQQREVDVRGFIQKSYTPYDGNDQSLEGPTENTTELWDRAMGLSKKKLKAGGVLGMDTKVISTIIPHGPSYLDRDKGTIVGFRIDKPFERSLRPYGSIRITIKACQDNGFEVDPEIVDFFTKHRKTHNAGIFDAYTGGMRTCCSSRIVTGLPDVYGRGRIAGNCRRIALYEINALVQEKKEEKDSTRTIIYSDIIREYEEPSEQARALEDPRTLGTIYGFDISRPATDVKGTIQRVYFGYLAAVKEQNGAAMSLRRTSTFLDIYTEHGLGEGGYTEVQIQEFMGHLIMKLRLVKFARTPEYNDLFFGNSAWVTESIGGIGIDGCHMVAKMSYRYLHTLHSLGTTSEPNLTILWSTRLSGSFKRFYTKTFTKSPSIQCEDDGLTRTTHGDDHTIVCCVSSIRMSRETQFFDARANLAKCLLYTVSGSVSEITGKQVDPKYRPITSEYLAFDEAIDKCKDIMKWFAKICVDTPDIIRYNHDKCNCERLQMALHGKKMIRRFAAGIVGPFVVVGSLSATKYAKVKTVHNEKSIVADCIVGGDLSKYSNSDDHVDQLAANLIHIFMSYIKGNHIYRGGIPATSTLTITSNAMYNKSTGSTPDGRKGG